MLVHLKAVKTFKSGPYCAISDNKFSSVTLNELAMKARKLYCNFENLNQDSRFKHYTYNSKTRSKRQKAFRIWV